MKDTGSSGQDGPVQRVRSIAGNVGLAVVATAATVVVVVLLLQAAGVNVAWQLWYFANSVTGTPRIGIWRADPTFGWVHIPDSSGRHRKPLAYDVTYTIDARGHRVTDGAYDRPKVLILGDSLTFGQGVEDSEPYPAILQGQFPGYKVINGGVSAWGTTQSLLQLEQQIQEHDDIELVVYSIIDDDFNRNYLRKTWLEHIQKSRGLQVPYYDVVDGKLVFQGLADAQGDGLEDSEALREKEIAVTQLLLARMAALSSEQSIPFVLVYLPTEDNSDFSQAMIAAVGADRFVDLRDAIDCANLHLRFDLHPNPECHRRIADALEPILHRAFD